MPTVYVVQKPLEKKGEEWVLKHPALESLASEFGRVHYLVTEPFIADRGPLMRQMQRGLKDIEPDDYLLPVGSPLAIMAATMVAARYNHGYVRALYYDKKAGRYFETELED